MENLDYRMRTGAWVGLLLAVVTMVGTVYLPIATLPKIASAFDDLGIPTQFGFRSLILSILIILSSLVSVSCFAFILIKQKNPLYVSIMAVISASLMGALISGALLITVKLTNLHLLKMTVSEHVLSIAIIIPGLGLILAIISVLQIEKVEDRKFGCLWIFLAIAAAAVILYILIGLMPLPSVNPVSIQR